MAEDEKGFTIKDKRAFDDKGDLKEEKPEEPPKREEKKEADEEDVAAGMGALFG